MKRTGHFFRETSRVFTLGVATRSFETLEEAENVMREWARFGVQNQCSEADLIYICDADRRLVRTWNWARKASEAPG